MTTMTSQQATSFDRFSGENANRINTSLQCGCKPYEDVFTYKRWQALGHQVKRGEKSISIPVIINTQVDDGESKKIRWTSHVFCRHQVKLIDDTTPEPIPQPQPQPQQPVNNNDDANIMKGWELV